MTDERNERKPSGGRRTHDAAPEAKPRAEQSSSALPCWPFPVGSQNHTDKAVKLKPYVPPKRRTLNQY
jgi:hypothetical protein